MLVLHSPDAQGVNNQVKTTTTSLMSMMRSEKADFAMLSKKLGSVDSLTNMDLNQLYLIAACLAKLRRATQSMIEVESAIWTANGDESKLPKDDDIERIWNGFTYH